MEAVWQQLQGVIGLWLAVALAAAVLSGWLRSAAFKGWWGEYQVKRWMAQDLPASQYQCAHNITLQLSDGSTTQIDHVVVSPYGLFVVETKHLQGWIFGSEKQRTWTQHIYHHRSSFQNPLLQNWRHIKALEEVLQVPLQHLYSVIVFTGNCHFKTGMPANVLQGRACMDWIQSHQKVVLSDEDVTRLFSTLSQRRLRATRATHQAHIAQLQERHAQPRLKVMPSQVPVVRKAVDKASRPALAPSEMPPLNEREAKPAAQIQHCPECGHSLVHRSFPDKLGTPQHFLRCGRFPHCRFLESVAEPAL